MPAFTEDTTKHFCIAKASPPALCLKITVINQACKFCRPSLPVLKGVASSGHNAWLCYLNMHFNFKGEATITTGSVNRLKLKTATTF